MNSPAALCRNLEQRERAAELLALLHRAEIEAAEAQHELARADPDCTRIDVLQSRATAARERVLHLRAALAA